MRPKLTYANVVASIALFVALGGTSIALTLPKDSVKSQNIAREAVRASDIAKGAVNSVKVKDGSLRAGDFKAGQLPAGPTGPKGEKGAKGTTGAKGAQGIPGISGLERAAAGSADNSESPKSVNATCAAGKQTIGGGYDISGGKTGTAPDGLANILVDVVIPSTPSPGSTGSYFVEAWEEEATADTWNITAYVLCADVEQ